MTHLVHNKQCPDLAGALGPCATLPLIRPLDVWRGFASEGRPEEDMPLHFPFPRPRDFDREVPCPLPAAFCYN